MRLGGCKMKYKILVDSSSDIPRSLVEKHGIRVIPIMIHFGDEEYLDGIDMSSDEFYEKLTTEEEIPKTSQITPDRFAKVFEEELKENEHIIYIGISSKASGTYQSANIALDMLEGDLAKRVSLVDSKMLSIGIGMLALTIASQLEAGKVLEKVLEEAEALKYKIEVVFSVNTLKYLKKGGRIKASSAAIGEVLNIKPILNVDEGITQTIGKVRGKKKVLNFMLDHMEETMDLDNTPFIAVAHALVPKDAAKLKEKIRERFNYQGNIMDADIGPIIGTHSGPGVIACMYIKR